VHGLRENLFPGPRLPKEEQRQRRSRNIHARG
jgi:hypothetical protein